MKANVGIENSSRKYLIESQEELIRAVKYKDMIAEGSGERIDRRCKETGRTNTEGKEPDWKVLHCN